MCGIAFYLAAENDLDCCEGPFDTANLRRRGPDACGCRIKDFDGVRKAAFWGFVLHMRGQLTAQPLEDSEGNVLLWNGEIFGGIEVGNGENDTHVLMRLLRHCNSESDVLDLLSRVQGPWALIYYKASSRTVWFGRDVFGRRSLLWRLPSCDAEPFVLSSVATTGQDDWEEVPASIYALTSSDVASPALSVRWHPWALYGEATSSVAQRLAGHKLVARGSQVPASAIGELRLSFELNSQLPPGGTPSFEGRSPADADDDRPGNGDGGSGSLEAVTRASAAQPSEPALDLLAASLDPVARALMDVLAESVRRRVTNHADRCQACESTSSTREVPPCPHATVAVLFSGGIDSLVLAALADRFVPVEKPIDLINVAFQKSDAESNPRRANKSSGNARLDQYDVPDRLTGYAGLRALGSRRRWNFIEVNVTLAELQAARRQHIAQLVLPRQTVLDDSIGCAVWFAARGTGVIKNPSGTSEDYASRAKVVLVGMGADEQLGGYSRHRTSFETSGWQGLLDEIRMELSRISERNLGRDDRIISDHGKEARFPFLDENVVSFLCALPLSHKMDLSLPRGVGEKLLLRLCALKLGLGMQAAMLPKRAIQFGSRIAKLEGRSERGSDVCSRFSEAVLL